MNTQEYRDMVETFKAQLNLTKGLIELADKKIESISYNNTDQLLEITDREERLAREIIALEKKRDMYIKKMEKEEKAPIKNMGELLRKLSPEIARELNSIAEELKYNLGILKEKNDVNCDLIAFVLEQVEIVNNLIVGDRVPTTYENTRFKKNPYVPLDSNFDSKY